MGKTFTIIPHKLFWNLSTTLHPLLPWDKLWCAGYCGPQKYQTHMSVTLISWIPITCQLYFTYWTMSQLIHSWNQLKILQLGTVSEPCL
jgi:hypothetical protein